MTTQLTLTSAFLFLVSIFGLSSCSQDRPDDWHLNEPTLESDARQPVFLKTAILKDLPGDSTLVLHSASGVPAKVTVESECHHGELFSKSRYTAQSTSHLLLRDLWPEDFWRSLDSEALKLSTCDFNITAENDVGSTHQFSMSGVSLLSFVDSEKASEQIMTNTKLSLNSTDITRLETFKKLATDHSNSQMPSQLNFICENFRNQIALQSSDAEKSEETVLEKLVTAPVAAASGIDPRAEKTIQTCRLLRVETDPLTHQPHYSLIPSFTFTFPPPKLGVTWSLGLKTATPVTWPNQSVFSISLMNTSGVTTAIEVPKDFGRVHMRLIGYASTANAWYGVQAGQFYEGSRVIDEALNVAISGGGERLADNDHWIFELAPNAILKIEAQIAPQDQCIGAAPFPNADLSQTGYAGLLYSFTKQISIRQLQLWDGSKHLTTDRVDLGLSPEAQHPSDEPTNFAPSESYLVSVTATGQLPQPLVHLSDHSPGAGAFSLDACYFSDGRNLRIVR